MIFTGIHHVVIRVYNLEESAKRWSENLGMAQPRFDENPSLGVKQAFFELSDGGFIELIAPLNAESPITRSLDTKGEGVHLVSMSVENPSHAAAELTGQGVTMLGEENGPFFVHPKSASGVMLGLAQG